MKLTCEKFGDTMDSVDAVCLHPEAYCKFRLGCIISFMEKEINDKKDSRTTIKPNLRK